MDTCLVCQHRDPTRPHACDPCRARLAAWIDDIIGHLPALVDALEKPTMPLTAGRTTLVEAPLPVRESVLNLLGPGRHGIADTLVPAVRTWVTSRVVTVWDPQAGRDVPRIVPVWHRELLRDPAGNPVMVPAGDQVGEQSLVAWATSWEAAWRARLGNPLDVETWATTSNDPSNALVYLAATLDAACDHAAGIGEFAAQARAMRNAIRAVTGDRTDQIHLGRCPQPLRDRDGQPGRCGADLWQDPLLARITCPRCHADWLKPRWYGLAVDIRRTWCRTCWTQLAPTPGGGTVCPAGCDATHLTTRVAS